VEFQVLGAVAAWHGAVQLDLGRRQERCLLGLLLLEAGRVVPAERLVDLLWRDTPPATGRRTVHTYVARLRGRLAPFGVRIVTRGSGYVIDIDPKWVDVHRFLAEVAAAREVTDPGERATALAKALTLWRGPLMAGVADEELVQRLGDGLEETRLGAVESGLEARLEAGQHGEVVGTLTDLVKSYPTREQLAGLLMLALYRCGRSADAVAVYREVRRNLVEELGLEPSDELQRLHRQILGNAPELAAPPARTAQDRPGQDHSLRRFLPRDVPDFTGRAADLARLDALAEEQPPGAAAVVISAIAGLAGVGKTALAIRWAHAVAPRFPDGQLYVNLRGYDRDAPMQPIEALGRLLRSLGVPPHGVPADPDEASALYRSRLADQRMLVLLDNAASAEQVRPLLPSSPHSLVVVTSRDDLAGLIARDGARRLTLDLMSTAEAVVLLGRIIGEERAAAESDAARRLAETCGLLPLAVRIAAANLLGRPEASIAEAVDELRGDRLAALAIETDPGTGLRAVFDQSYRSLSEAGRRVFGLLGLAPGEDIGAAAVASLAGLPVDDVEHLLDALARASLVNHTDSDRFTLHDLVREYARSCALRDETDSERRAAVHRLLDHHLRAGHAAALQLGPSRDPISLPPAVPGTIHIDSADHEQALGWFTVEHRPLLALLDLAAEQEEFRPYGWRLAWTMSDFFDWQGHWRDWAHTHEVALRAITGTDDREGQAQGHRGLGRANVRLGRFDVAVEEFAAALGWFGQLDDRSGQAHVHLDLAWMCDSQSRYAQASDHADRALALFRTIGNTSKEAHSLAAIGWYAARQGDYEECRRHLVEALALYQRNGDQHGEATASESLGYAYHHLGRHADAVRQYNHALDLCQSTGDRYGETVVLDRLGDVRRDMGALDAARDAWTRAADILEDLGNDESHRVRAKLAAVLPGGLGLPAEHGTDA
jgi:DNA-binding SARP family transcriptional activator/tetratricopeptide (TPR) repeat protein